MAQHDDQALLETVRTHRERLTGALLHGSLGTRRTARSLTRRLIVGIVLAAIASAACVGVGFVTDLLAQKAEAETSVTDETVVPTPQITSATEEQQ